MKKIETSERRSLKADHQMIPLEAPGLIQPRSLPIPTRHEILGATSLCRYENLATASSHSAEVSPDDCWNGTLPSMLAVDSLLCKGPQPLGQGGCKPLGGGVPKTALAECIIFRSGKGKWHNTHRPCNLEPYPNAKHAKHVMPVDG